MGRRSSGQRPARADQLSSSGAADQLQWGGARPLQDGVTDWASLRTGGADGAPPSEARRELRLDGSVRVGDAGPLRDRTRRTAPSSPGPPALFKAVWLDLSRLGPVEPARSRSEFHPVWLWATFWLWATYSGCRQSDQPRPRRLRMRGVGASGRHRKRRVTIQGPRVAGFCQLGAVPL